MDDVAIIVLVVLAFILVIVIIAASAKKKKLNNAGSNLTNVALNEESQQITSSERRETPQQSLPLSPNREGIDLYSTLLYYVYFEGATYGPFDLNQLKSYPLLEDTLITTNTLNGTWYEAKYFECLDDLFMSNEKLPFTIDSDGTIIRLEQNGVPN
jgi:hypothetical protein